VRRRYTAASLICHQVIAELVEHHLDFQQVHLGLVHLGFQQVHEVQDDLVEGVEEVADSGEVEATQLWT
jgi:DNA-binding ferritin-like protein